MKSGKHRYHNPAPPPIPWVTEAFFDFWSTRFHPLWTLRRPLARLVSRRAEGTAAVTVVLQPNRHFTGLQPGQHVNLTLEVDGRMTTRSYSPTQLADGRLEITVKLVRGGKVSAWLAGGMPIGATMGISAAYGEMTVHGDGTPLLLLAAGSGITPMRALLRQLDAAGMPVAVDLVYWVRQRGEQCFAGELATLAGRHPNFRLQLAVTGDAQAPAARIGQYDLSAIDGLAGRRVLACGPAGFVATARERLAGQVARFEAEAFSLPELPDTETGEVQLTLSRSGRTLSVPRGTALLTALEAQGINPPAGCRMGVCNTCACEKGEGIVRNTLNGERSAEPSTRIKLCVNSASTDLILEL